MELDLRLGLGSTTTRPRRPQLSSRLLLESASGTSTLNERGLKPATTFGINVWLRLLGPARLSRHSSSRNSVHDTPTHILVAQFSAKGSRPTRVSPTSSGRRP